jgi:cytoskeletal protein RodZ
MSNYLRLQFTLVFIIIAIWVGLLVKTIGFGVDLSDFEANLESVLRTAMLMILSVATLSKAIERANAETTSESTTSTKTKSITPADPPLTQQPVAVSPLAVSPIIVEQKGMDNEKVTDVSLPLSRTGS